MSENSKETGNIFSKIIMLLITIILSFVAWQSRTWTNDIRTLSTSVAELNTSMAVVVNNINQSVENSKKLQNKVEIHDQLLADHEIRIRLMEKK